MNTKSFEQWISEYFTQLSKEQESFKAADELGYECGGECDCAELLVNIFALIDRQLPSKNIARLLAHARNCPDCAQYLYNEQRFRELMRKSVANQAPASLRIRITQTFYMQ